MRPKSLTYSTYNARQINTPQNTVQFGARKKYVELIMTKDMSKPVEVNKNVPAKRAKGLYKLLWFYKAAPVLKPVFKRLFRSILPG